MDEWSVPKSPKYTDSRPIVLAPLGIVSWLQLGRKYTTMGTVLQMLSA